MDGFEQKRKKLREQFKHELEMPVDHNLNSRGRYNTWGYHPECPYAHKNTGRVTESRYVWWLNHPEDPILRGEHIHHINLNRSDNRIENLKKVKVSDHRQIHTEIRRCKMLKKMDGTWYNPVRVFVDTINNPDKFIEHLNKKNPKEGA